MTPTLDELELLVVDYLTVRRSLGYKLDNAEHILGRFLDYLREHDAPGITVHVAIGFAMAPPARTPRTQALRLSAIRCFARWAHCQDFDIEIPPAGLLPARPTRVAPYIYTDEEIQALLAAAGLLEPDLRAASYCTLIGLMAATGIRTGEVIGLNIADFNVDAQTLMVTGKYGKIRLLPLHPSITDALSGYLHQRDRMLPAAACPALLISTKGTRLRPSGVHPTFRGIADQAGLRPTSSSCRPRLHDLRHTFAVATMLDAYRSGADPAVVLPILSTWLGHTEPSDTYWYLSGTSELMAAATQRLQTSGPHGDRSRS